MRDNPIPAACIELDDMELVENDEPLHISVNGHEVIRPPTKIAHSSARQYYTNDWGSSSFDNWFEMELPVEALQTGINYIEMWVESVGTTWEVMVAADYEFARGNRWPASTPATT